MNFAGIVIALIFFIAGLIGTVLPLLPGPILVFLGMLIYGFITGFTILDSNFFLLQFVVLLILFLIDYVSSVLGTKISGGSRGAMIGTMIGIVMGPILLGPLGVVIGPFAGAVFIEIINGSELQKALRIGFGTFIGILGGTILKIFIELVMIIYFFVSII
ncbi:DUF456 domain-containing protein [Alkalibacter mobilis]|uniref:DUF456 domain-containing protein n=1 Tax=Alkalibacter mobilis TaxID=2787712 RepID=UPI00189EAACF|nr:DUF456 domain-containing protein [Alkalibacter mobilis]MBF7097433.1 DUF456 domain-containing protein [Alkalibacter mobilis]